jgi:ATPase family AAA domain-containing protein 3A/B
MSEVAQNVLNTVLYHTGEQSFRFMLVLATNRPEDLDEALLDRMDEVSAWC